MLRMVLDHTLKQRSNVVPYKRGTSNTYGIVDLAGVAPLVHELGVVPPKAR